MGKSLDNYVKSDSHPSLLVRDAENHCEVRSQSVFFYGQKSIVNCRRKKKKGNTAAPYYCVLLDYFHTYSLHKSEYDFTVSIVNIVLEKRFLSGFIYYPK